VKNLVKNQPKIVAREGLLARDLPERPATIMHFSRRILGGAYAEDLLSNIVLAVVTSEQYKQELYLIRDPGL